ncbi:MAG: acetyltransferase [Methyloligellaceae bacterium]
MSNDIAIIGAGGHGRVCAEAAALAGFRVVGFCDPSKARGVRVNGVPVIGGTPTDLADRLAPADVQVFVAVGDNETRANLLEEVWRLGFRTPALIHPSSVISPTAEIGDATVVLANAVINANARTGRGCIVNSAATIDHDNVLENMVQICPGVRSAGTVHFRSRSFVGTGAILTPGVIVGRRAMVAAGAVVVSDVPDEAHVAGVPAKTMSRSQPAAV